MGKFRSMFTSLDYPQLQNLIKRDPKAYKEEFQQQLQHFESSFTIFQLNPIEKDENFCELVSFISHAAPHFPKECINFPNQLMSLLKDHSTTLDPLVRKNLVRALILLRNRNFISETTLLPLFFTLFKVQDKVLREILYSHIVNDIKKLNLPHKNLKANKVLQNFMYEMMVDPCPIAIKKSLQVMIELYRKNIWNDQKTVNILTEACMHQDVKVASLGLNFFLNNQIKQDLDLDDPTESLKEIQFSQKVFGSKKSHESKLKRVMASIKRKETKKDEISTNFPPLFLINDPQTFAEKLFSKLKNSKESFEHRILLMSLISKLISSHKLLLLGFYSFLQRYVQPHQNHVTTILALCSSSCHDLIPSDELDPLIKTLANNFVADHCATEVMTVGLNTLREICSRCPLAMTEELLQDLTNYKKYKDKGVMMAARSLISVFREKNPLLLHRRDRGKEASMSKNLKPVLYGEQETSTFIPGTEALEEKDQLANDQQDDDQDDIDNEDEEMSIDDEEEEEFDEEDYEDEDMEDLESAKEELESTAKRPRVETMKLLTDQDFKRIKEFKNEAASESSESEQDETKAQISKIQSHLKKGKQTYEERLASIKEGREGREKFGSKKGKSRSSTNNKEKAKKKNFMMIAHKSSTRAKAKLSLKQKTARKRASVIKQKKQRH